MSDEKSEGGGSFFNPNALLAILTVAGGLWLVSQKLTSDRPVAPASGARESLGAQKLEARLWEDPFKLAADDKGKTSVKMEALVDQIARQKDTGRTPANGVLLLPAFLSGGLYSEDQESRIRSRFAIVSALGQSGYVPVDAEHIGVLSIPWLAEELLGKALSDKASTVTQLWAPGEKTSLLGVETTAENSAQIDVRYEWYRRRDFSQGSSVDPAWSWVLVLWLDESYFTDEPLVRLALLLDRLTDPTGLDPEKQRRGVALLGPRNSATLRAMVKDWRPEVRLLSHIDNPGIRSLTGKVLQRIDVFCATPSVMDEVLVENPDSPNENPRTSVRAKLTFSNHPDAERAGFKSFHNLAATDAQLAREIFEELKLRRAGPLKTGLGKATNHVVLISEWDTFYGRMLSLTYGAELAVMQGSASSRADFVDKFIHKKESLPKNFHSFAYLRGLDGQTVGGEGKPEEGGEAGGGSKAPQSIEEFRLWAPDVNKAEGQAQFDYLGRLGDQIAELQKKLTRAEEGRIKAIGIVGSDVYDTLLILQALRNRFPAVLFFTTDLDVRFLHPVEREWAHNLIVVSPYGLALHRDLQGSVAPFRDSTQTAQFAATLAALGNNDLANIAKVPPRRFEVGNRGAMDMSVEGGAMVLAQPQPAGGKPSWLHPLTRSERFKHEPPDRENQIGHSLFVAGLLLAFLIWRWRPLRCLTWEAFVYPAEALEYTEEDVGGIDGVEVLLRALDEDEKNEAARWLVARPQIVALRKKLSAKAAVESDPRGDEARREKDLDLLVAALCSALNQLIQQEPPDDSEAPLPKVPARPEAWETRWFGLALRLWPQANRMIRRFRARRWLDVFLQEKTCKKSAFEVTEHDYGTGKLANFSGSIVQRIPFADRLLSLAFGNLITVESKKNDEKLEDSESALHAAVFARESARALFRLRCRRLVTCWAGAVVIACASLWLVRAIWFDTWMRADGEPFSLTSGTSAWPAVVVRAGIVVLGICFSLGLSLKLRGAYHDLTRRFRLSPPEVDRTDVSGKVCAREIWYDYGDRTRFRRRWLWIICLMVLYYYLSQSIRIAIGESAMQPLRGLELIGLNLPVLRASFFAFLLLAFITVDAACRCREFIEKLSSRPTRYPTATRRHFSRQMGRIDEEYVDEWIDLQWIAELTEHVGRLVYFPSFLAVLMLLARNSWWDCWSWTLSSMIIFAFNFTLALTSVVILQRAAREAKRKAEQSLTAKIKRLQAQVAPSEAQNNASQAEQLLKEINQLHRGAFVPFWENPVVGALFLSSGGTTLLHVAILFMGR